MLIIHTKDYYKIAYNGNDLTFLWKNEACYANATTSGADKFCNVQKLSGFKN